MLSCAEFVDRLYDEDSRRGLSGSGPIPPDLAPHLAACSDCQRVWADAIEDARVLPLLLLESVPQTLERRIRAQVAERRPTEPALDWAQALTWAAMGAGLAVALVATRTLPPELASLGPLTLSLVGASIAFAVSAAREALWEALA